MIRVLYKILKYKIKHTYNVYFVGSKKIFWITGSKNEIFKSLTVIEAETREVQEAICWIGELGVHKGVMLCTTWRLEFC